MPKGTYQAALTDSLAPILADPPRSAVMLDLDGTLAPIVARPEDSAISDPVRELLAAIAARYGLCAIVSGRRAGVARQIVGLDELAYAGNHGFELIAPGAGADADAELAAAVLAHADVVAAFARRLDRDRVAASGVSLEDKGSILALHWRRAANADAAEELVEQIAAEAEQAGLFIHCGRKVLELRPPVAIDKGVAVAELLGRGDTRAALYAGDDRTDLDAFAELARRHDDGELDAIVRVGVRSAEGPAEIAEQADLVVEGPEQIPPLLEVLAG